MTDTSNQQIHKPIYLTMLISLFALSPVIAQAQDGRPVADAGLSRYAGPDPIVLDGTDSYDPDESGPLSYSWQQISGPNVIIIDANTATPTIGGAMQPGTGRDVTPKIVGFIQTDVIQICEFELVVSDSEMTSIPDTVAIIIVPDFGASTLRLENPPFEPDKPTVVYFGGGDCIVGGGTWDSAAWAEKANIISFPTYGPDPGDGDLRTYYRYGDMIIVYLSSVAPDYKQPIQTTGWSTGGQPAIDVGIHLNLTYGDGRYAINRVTFYDATPYCRSYYSESINTFLASSVNGEQCWIDNYVTTVTNQPSFHSNVLNVGSEISDHSLAPNWYKASLTGSDMNKFNNGVVGGAYWSVIGPGKNLQLASTPDVQTYKFKWYGSASTGYMDYYDKSAYPAKLPEPVTLLAWSDALDGNNVPTGALLTCGESENAIGYELLLGPDPYHVMDYDVISDTLSPPTEVITTFPFEETWWTIRIRDEYGSTIYADPIRVSLESLPLPTIENLTNGKRYGNIQFAINDANSGDEIVVGPGIYQENISFKGKNLTLRAKDPDDPVIVEATVIDGTSEKSVVTFYGGEDASCLLAGFTVTGGSTGICCRVASPTISNCIIGESGTTSIELWQGSEPIINDCTIFGDVVVRPFAENLTSGERYINIQRAINNAMSGDEIVVSEGTWKENIDFRGKNLFIRSTNPEDSNVVAATVFIGDDDGNLITFSNNEDSNCVLAGVTITNANNGIYCSATSPMIIHCNIFANRDAGIRLNDSSNPTITKCNITGNGAAGIYLEESEATITNCSVAGNSGAGIELYNNSNPTISNCIIAGNSGSGIAMLMFISGRTILYNSPAIVNCTIVGNSDIGISEGKPTVLNSIIYGNGVQIAGSYAVVQYSNIQSGFPGEGNIDTNPLFADPINGDYHLKSQTGRWDCINQIWIQDDGTSPCIDAGDPLSPIGDEPEPNGGRINIGAYGGTIEASKSP